MRIPHRQLEAGLDGYEKNKILCRYVINFANGLDSPLRACMEESVLTHPAAAACDAINVLCVDPLPSVAAAVHHASQGNPRLFCPGVVVVVVRRRREVGQSVFSSAEEEREKSRPPPLPSQAGGGEGERESGVVVVVRNHRVNVA